MPAPVLLTRGPVCKTTPRTAAGAEGPAEGGGAHLRRGGCIRGRAPPTTCGAALTWRIGSVSAANLLPIFALSVGRPKLARSSTTVNMGQHHDVIGLLVSAKFIWCDNFAGLEEQGVAGKAGADRAIRYLNRAGLDEGSGTSQARRACKRHNSLADLGRASADVACICFSKAGTCREASAGLGEM